MAKKKKKWWEQKKLLQRNTSLTTGIPAVLKLKGHVTSLSIRDGFLMKLMCKSLLSEKIQFGYKYLSNIQKAYFPNITLWLIEDTPKSFSSIGGVISLMELV